MLIFCLVFFIILWLGLEENWRDKKESQRDYVNQESQHWDLENQGAANSGKSSWRKNACRAQSKHEKSNER